jgi:hypothetical protein
MPHNLQSATAWFTPAPTTTTPPWVGGAPRGRRLHAAAEDVAREKAFARRYLGTDGTTCTGCSSAPRSPRSPTPCSFPLQDVLGLGSEARMNLPGRQAGNWGFRFTWEQLTPHSPSVCTRSRRPTNDERLRRGSAVLTPRTTSAPTNFWSIWNMSFGFLGIQFGWGLQMANMSAIYEYLGAKPDEIPCSGWPRRSPGSSSSRSSAI